MNLQNILHFASYLKWAFLLAVIILIFYSLRMLPEILISIIGIFVFLIGIYLSLDSLGDMEKMSEKGKNFYRNIQALILGLLCILKGTYNKCDLAKA